MSIDYGIEWAYGEFRIARLRAGEVVESWKSPVPVTDLTSLRRAMHIASGIIDISRGGSVAIAYEDDLHTHEFLEIPPMSGRDQKKFMQRHVDAAKPFQGEGAWRAHPVERNGISGVLLHLMPKEILDTVMRICEDYYLMPKLLVPLTEIMSEFVPALEADSDRALLMIALFDDRTQMLVSSAEGEILFVRELSYAWMPQSNGRLVVDINRTIGYAKQRIGGEIDQAWLVGERAEQARELLDDKIDATISYDARAAEPEFWMRQVAALPQRLASNFIPVFTRRSLSVKTFARAGLLMAAVLAFAAVLITTAVEGTILSHRMDVERIESELAAKRLELADLRSQAERMQAEETKLDILNIDEFNLPAIFLSHLGDLVPEGLVLTEATITHEDESKSWQVSLKGETLVPLDALAPVLTLFQTRLTEAPWHTGIAVSWEQGWLQQLQEGGATQDGDIGFEIQGRLR
ncbi:MAG: hypothetical protein AAGA84_00245 [Pseudomonadota bacterium]